MAKIKSFFFLRYHRNHCEKKEKNHITTISPIQCFSKAIFLVLTLKAPQNQKISSLKYDTNNCKCMVAFVSSASGKRTM